MNTTGRILVDGGLLLDNVDVFLRVTETTSPRSWRGSFTHKDAWSLIEEGATCTLVLQDGRSGEFVVSGMGGSESIPPTVFFVGTGPLE